MNRKIIFLYIICIFNFLLFTVSCSGKNTKTIVSGVFEGEAQSLFGNMKVRVFIEKNSIKNIEILEYADTPGYSDTVFEHLPRKIIESNSADVDIIIGATITSSAVLNAIKDALKKAGLYTENLHPYK